MPRKSARLANQPAPPLPRDQPRQLRTRRPTQVVEMGDKLDRLLERLVLLEERRQQAEQQAAAQAEAQANAQPQAAQAAQARLARKLPTAALHQAKLEGIQDPKAFAAWRKFWTRQVAGVDNAVAVAWLRAHTAGDAFSLLHSKVLADPTAAFDAIRVAAVQREQLATKKLYDTTFVPSETPRQLVERLDDYADLYKISADTVLDVLRSATESFFEINITTAAAVSPTDWLAKLEGARYADKPFERMYGGKHAATSSTSSVAAALSDEASTSRPRRSRGSGQKTRGASGGARFEGNCYNCGKFGHMASECYSARPTGGGTRGGRGRGRGRRAQGVAVVAEHEATEASGSNQHNDTA